MNIDWVPPLVLITLIAAAYTLFIRWWIKKGQ